MLRAGTTFRYTASGSEGLLIGKRAVITVARAGAYSQGSPEHQLSHVRTLLAFMGVTDVEVVLAEGLARGAETAAATITAAKAAIDHLVRVPA